MKLLMEQWRKFLDEGISDVFYHYTNGLEKGAKILDQNKFLASGGFTKDVESELKLSSKGKVLNVVHGVKKVALEDVSVVEEEVQTEVTLKVYVVFGLRPVMVYGLITSLTVTANPSGSVYSKSKLSEPSNKDADRSRLLLISKFCYVSTFKSGF